MLKNSMLMFIVLCCLCVSTRVVNAKKLPEQDTIKAQFKSSDVLKVNVETSSTHEATTDLSLASEDPVNVQNTSIQAAIQKPLNAPMNASGASVQVPSDQSRLIRIPLSLSLDSVDDMYYGCSERMLIKVKRHFLPRSTREGLHSTYTGFCALKAMKNKDIYDQLSRDHFRALCAYTAGSYYDLNHAVRRGKASYSTSFEFNALHFLLSDAIRLLKVNQRSCFTTYRRSRLLFSGELGQTIRFGSFASSSFNKNLHQFGRGTCFEIDTCYGAYLKSYSEFDSDEDEVLIPPYEMFNIVSVDMSGENDLHCHAFYKLETAGVYSNLNCQAVDPSKLTTLF
ncbi:NAD(P)(+)--arginine ADP-ribosyltransferase 1-like [Anoplopoma fimbria]|uniref:NAD(P)(+)--arginine ADP-ribosyltransferase 1-like n=1 Tax=Anoplopoma fimbria TaxID=229290 RepID=UPI0023EADF64|nr:NAD(P)(+)--arginine ADP-ribosyltransferase 1-like [Anoplopoma fimbria]